MNVVSVRGGKVHTMMPGTEEHPYPLCRGGGMNNTLTKFTTTNTPIDCKTCTTYAERRAAKAAEADAERKAAETEAKANETAWDALKYTTDGGAANLETCERCLWSAEDNADDTSVEEGFETHTERWYGVAVATYSSAHGSHMSELENLTGNALGDAGIEDEAEAVVYAEVFRDAIEGGYDYRQAKDIAAEALPTHVSSLIVSAPHDNDRNEGGTTMAAKKLKLKDVRGDIRIGSATGSNGTMHALRFATDEKGRNLSYCRTTFKTPLRSFGPAMDQKPELELCAGCSKVVPTGEVVVTHERVKVPGLNVTVNQKKITPVEGDEEGENMPPKKKTAAAKPAQDVDALISDVHGLVDTMKGAADVETVDSLAGDAEKITATLPTAKRNPLRKAVNDAKKARLAELNPEPETGTDVERVHSRSGANPAADVAEDFNAIEGVPELIKEGVKYFSQGVDLGLKLTNVGEKTAHTMLAMRQKIINPVTKLPDLMADTKTAKNAAAELYALARKAIADDDVERQGAHNSLVRATQNKSSDVLVDWLRAFDGPDRKESLAVMTELFGKEVTAKVTEDGKLSDAVYALYADKEITLPRYGRTELARYDRRVKAIESVAKELETLKESDDADDAKVGALEDKIVDLKADVPEDILHEKTAPKTEKTDAEKTAEALTAVKAQLEKAGKRFSKVKTANDKRKAKAEMYSIIRSAADAFDLDLSALVTSDDDEA